MPRSQPNAVAGLPYTLVEVDERPKPARERLREADSLQWKLWIQKYAWLLSMVTVAPGLALIAYTVTGNLPLALGVTALGVLAPALVFWRRTRRLP